MFCHTFSPTPDSSTAHQIRNTWRDPRSPIMHPHYQDVHPTTKHCTLKPTGARFVFQPFPIACGLVDICVPCFRDQVPAFVNSCVKRLLHANFSDTVCNAQCTLLLPGDKPNDMLRRNRASRRAQPDCCTTTNNQCRRHTL